MSYSVSWLLTESGRPLGRRVGSSRRLVPTCQESWPWSALSDSSNNSRISDVDRETWGVYGHGTGCTTPHFPIVMAAPRVLEVPWHVRAHSAGLEQVHSAPPQTAPPTPLPSPLRHGQPQRPILFQTHMGRHSREITPL